MDKTRKRRFTPGMVAILMIAFFTFTAADGVSKNTFERLPHLEDEFGYLFQAKIFARGYAWVTRSDNDPVKYFWQPFVLQPDTPVNGVYERFGKYTPGWPLLLALGVIMGQWWIVNAFLGMLSVVLTYRMTREIFNEAVGLMSALLLAISPMALLLNGTLMSHVSAMTMSIVFVYAYWRVTRHGKGRYYWAILSGLGIGWVIATRPLTALAIAAPVALHALSSLFDEPKKKLTLLPDTQAESPKSQQAALMRLGNQLMPLIVMAIFVLPTAGLWAWYNYVWTGDWKTNTYTLLWPYDQVGFGKDHGLMQFVGCDSRYGCHTLEFGLRNARADLEVYFRDLFGFTMAPGFAQYASDNLGWGAGIGLSWILVVVGLIAGRKKEWIWLFFELLVAIVIAQLTYWIGSVVRGTAAYSLRYYYEATFGVCIVGGYGAVALAKWIKENKETLFWIALIVFLALQVNFITSQAYSILMYEAMILVVAALAYYAWGFIMAQRAKHLAKNDSVTINFLNGTRTSIAPESSAAALLTRPNKTFIDRLILAWDDLWPGQVLILIVIAASLFGYTPARFAEPLSGWPNGLFRYNKVGQQQIDALNKIRQESEHPDQPVLLLILHDPDPSVADDWRDYGAAMALESPFLDGDIVVARVFDQSEVDGMIQRFPGRLVLYQVGSKLALNMDSLLSYNSAQR